MISAQTPADPKQAPAGIPLDVPLLKATDPAGSRTEVFVCYLEFYRSQLAARLTALPSAELGRRRLPSDWSPLELLKHLRYMERRWLEWGFEGRPLEDPWGDRQDGRWHVEPDETLPVLLAALAGQAARSNAIINAHDLSDVGQPSERWNGAAPPTLERILFHMFQEYARHLGHLDIVVEVATGGTGG